MLNIIGNYVLIFGHAGFPELGLLGAADKHAFRPRRGRLHNRGCVQRQDALPSLCRCFQGCLSDPAPRRIEVWETSYPVMIQNGIECALWTLGAIVCGWFGKLQLAAYQVVNTMAQLGFMTYISFGVATSIRIANAMGISDFQGIRRSASAGLHITLLLATLASAVFILAGKGLIGLFTPDVGVVGAARLLIVPLVLYQYGDAVQLTYANALRGTGDVKPLLAGGGSRICPGGRSVDACPRRLAGVRERRRVLQFLSRPSLLPRSFCGCLSEARSTGGNALRGCLKIIVKRRVVDFC